MAKRENDAREPLSFWGTVGANIVGGLIMGGVTTLAAMAMVAAVGRRVERLEAAAAPQQPLPPGGG